MNGMNNSTEDVVECPLCMEPLDVDDINFYPCTCGYQICRFCWHRIRTDENELCPACRKAYSENPAEFKPLSEEQMTALKTEKRLRDQKRKQKITENRKHLANVRVVQKNLVFVVGLPPRLADAEVLKKFEYFGKHGKIHKVVINPSTAYAGVQGPSASAYVTYCNNNDALRAIQTANNVHIDGRLIKSSLGTTKYCSHFMKNQQCPKPDCMYLHDLGDDEASFTKEEMHQGKHQEYEKRLHDALIAQTAAANNAPNSNNAKVDETKPIDTPNGLAQNNKEAWPCLSVSPTNKDTKTNGKAGKDAATKKSKSEKVKAKKVTTNGTTAYTNGKENGFTANKDANGVTDTLLDKQKATMDADEELNLISEIENDALLADVDKTDTPSISSSSSGRSGTLSETASGKSTPGSFNDHPLQNSQTNHQQQVEQQNKTNLEKSSQLLGDTFGNVPISSEINTNCHSLTNGIAKIDTTDQFSKLSLFDNNSFFSNTFQPTTYFKMDQQQHRTGDSLSSTNSPQLPDLLNGTEISKERHERHEIDKLNILKGLGEFNQVNNLPGYSNTTENWDDLKYAMTKNKQSQLHQQQQQQKHQLEPDDLLNYQELQKRHNYINHTNSLGMPHFNGLQNDFSNDYFHNPSESSRFSQMLSQQQQQQNQNHARQQQPNGIHSSDNLNHIYPASMSKFFDFHKVQQQQQQQQQQNQQQNQYFNNSSRSDHMNVSNLMENHRLNSQFLDHTLNGLSGGSHVLHKQRMMPKFDQQLGSPQQQQQQQQQQQLNHNLLHSQQSNSRLPNQFSSNNADDDLGFDPFSEVQKDYEIFENESNHSKLLENCQRTRMPPPGFNHMNAFGLGVPRAQGSKILPFMNMGNCAQSPQSNWGQPQQQQQQNLGYQQSYDQSQNHLSQQNHQLNKGGYGSADWTMFDPAIVSMRQFPSQQSHADMFMPHLNQQQQQQQQTIQQQLGGQGLFENKLKNIDFSNRSGMLGGYGGGPHGMNLQNSIMNQQQQQQQQQNSPAQVNFSHSNWLNTDQTQNIFLNNLSNGFSNNFEKYSIPPGFQNSGSKQQKAECIN